MSTQGDKVIEKARRIFEEDPAVILAYLYGSRARGEAVATSDHDFAVYVDPALSKDKRFEKRLGYLGKLNGPGYPNGTDVVVLNDVRSIPLRFSIIKDGQVIINRDEGSRLDLEVAIMSDYYDFRPYLDMYFNEYVSR